MKISPEIMSLFPLEGRLTAMETYGNGLINDTFLVTTENAKYILQRVNKNIFDNQALIGNYEQLEDSRKLLSVVRIPELLRSKEGKLHVTDGQGYAWRLSKFIESGTTYSAATATNISHRAASAFGFFQHFLLTLDPSLFQETITRFHDPENRFSMFLEATHISLTQRKKEASEAIGAVHRFSFLTDEYIKLKNNMLMRLTHGDLKLNNVIFHEQGDYVIDLDTVMPGWIIFDFGDMVRSIANPGGEEENNLSKIYLNEDHFEAITSAYLFHIKKQLQPIEKECLLIGAKLIIFEQAVRFLTDYLNGDIYFRTFYPQQNLIRAQNQIKLLESLFATETRLQSIINKHSI